MYFKMSSEIAYKKPPLEAFLGEYNTMFASLLARNFGDLAYISSPVINRMEGKTHFYEKLEKYLQLKDLLATDGGLGIMVTKDDGVIYPALRKEFGKRVKMARENGNGGVKGVKEFIGRMGIVSLIVRLPLFFFKTISLISACRGLRPRGKRYHAVIRSYFDFRCIDEKGRLREEYFGQFAADLSRREKLLVVYKLLHPRELSLFKRLRRQQHEFDSCLLESFLSLPLLLRAIYGFCSSRIILKEKCIYRGNDITSLIQEMIDREFHSLGGLDVFVEYEAAREILKLRPQRIYFPYENQSWEKVYPLARKVSGIQNIRIIGFQHSSISYKYIMHFPAEEERGLAMFPDKILTVGRIYCRLLKEKAFYPCEITEGAALRTSKYVANGRFNIKPPHKELKKKLAFAFSYDLSKYRDIIRVLAEVFGGSSIIMYLKIHPDHSEAEVVRSLGMELPGNFVLAGNIGWEKIYDDVDCVIYDDNSIGVEAMINGVKTFMLDVSEPIYECGRMFYFTEWETAIGIEGLRKLRDEIESGRFSPWYDAARIKTYLDDYYNAYTSERFFESYR